MSFPETFPDNFETNILPEDVSFEDVTVYRVLKFGELNNEAFMSTHDEIIHGLRDDIEELSLNDPSRYSTSCYDKPSKAKKCLKMFMRREPRAKLAIGTTKGLCGPHQVTFIRTQKSKHHIDWWIYKDASPVDYFKMVNENE